VVQGVNLAGIDVVGQAAPLEQRGQTAGNSGGDARDLVVIGGRQGPEANALRVIGVVDPVQHQRVEVNIEVERASEPLHEGRAPHRGVAMRRRILALLRIEAKTARAKMRRTSLVNAESYARR